MLTAGWQPLRLATSHSTHPHSHSTYAKKVTVSVLYSYEKLSGHIKTAIFGNGPERGQFFFALLAQEAGARKTRLAHRRLGTAILG